MIVGVFIYKFVLILKLLNQRRIGFRINNMQNLCNLY